MAYKNINILPTEILLMIMEYCDQGTLARVALTCKRFHDIAVVVLWKEPIIREPKQLSTFLSHLKPHVVRSTRSGNTQRLKRNMGELITCLFLDAPLIRDSITDVILTHILASVSHCLTRLDLSSCIGLRDPVVYDSLCLSGLTAFSLAGCAQFEERCLLRLVKQMPSLKILNLNDVALASDKTLMCLAQHCKQLRTLSMNGCQNITDKGMTMLFKNCPYLSEVSISCTNLTDISMFELARSCPDLIYLRTTSCKSITSRGLSDVVLKCPNLRYLFVAGCEIDDSLLYNMRLEVLKFIDLAYCSSISLPAFEYMLLSCPQLEQIGLGACYELIGHSIIRLLSQKPPREFPDSVKSLYCVIKNEDVSRLRHYIKLTKSLH